MVFIISSYNHFISLNFIFLLKMPVVKPVAQPAVSSTTDDVEVEEEEEEEEEEEKKESRTELMETDKIEENVKDVTGIVPVY